MPVIAKVKYWPTENLGFGHISVEISDTESDRKEYISWAMTNREGVDRAKHGMDPIEFQLPPSDVVFQDFFEIYKNSAYYLSLETVESIGNGYFNQELSAYGQRYDFLSFNCAHAVERVLYFTGYQGSYSNQLGLRPYTVAQKLGRLALKKYRETLLGFQSQDDVAFIERVKSIIETLVHILELKLSKNLTNHITDSKLSRKIRSDISSLKNLDTFFQGDIIDENKILNKILEHTQGLNDKFSIKTLNDAFKFIKYDDKTNKDFEARRFNNDFSGHHFKDSINIAKFILDRLDFFYNLAINSSRNDEEEICYTGIIYEQCNNALLNLLLKDLGENLLKIDSSTDEFIGDIIDMYEAISDKNEDEKIHYVLNFISNNGSIEAWRNISTSHYDNPCFNQFYKATQNKRIPYLEEIEIENHIKELEHYSESLPKNSERRTKCNNAIEEHRQHKNFFYENFYDNLGMYSIENSLTKVQDESKNSGEVEDMKYNLKREKYQFLIKTKKTNSELDDYLQHRTPWILRRFKDFGMLIAGLLTGGGILIKNMERTLNQTGELTYGGLAPSVTRGQGFFRKYQNQVSNIVINPEESSSTQIKLPNYF